MVNMKWCWFDIAFLPNISGPHSRRYSSWFEKLLFKLWSNLRICTASKVLQEYCLIPKFLGLEPYCTFSIDSSSRTQPYCGQSYPTPHIILTIGSNHSLSWESHMFPFQVLQVDWNWDVKVIRGQSEVFPLAFINDRGPPSCINHWP